MKRQFLIAAGFVMTGSMLFLASCSKNDAGDTTAPVITLNGASAETIILNSGTWTDPGATATDDQDGSVTVTSDAGTTNPNPNRANTYTITYTAHDAAGNVGTATRSVRVKNEAEDYAGTYSVHDTCNGNFFAYAQTITIDSTLNNRVRFNKWADYANNTGIYAIMLGDGSLQIPSQSATSIGTGTGQCSIADHTFVSTSNSSLVINGFKITYTDQVTSPALCVGSTTCTAWYQK